MKKILLILSVALMGVGQVWATDSEWYMYTYYGDANHYEGCFQTTGTENVFKFEKLHITQSGGFNFRILQNNAWTTTYGWHEDVTTTGQTFTVDKDKGNGWSTLPEGYYNVTFNLTNTTIQFDPCMSISSVGFGTYYSNYAYTMPTGVTGYIVTPGVTAGTITVTETYIAGDKVPRYTGLLIKGAENNYSLTYDYSDETAAPSENRLGGSATAKSQSSWEGSDSKNVLLYKLANDGTNGLGWYWDSADGQSLNCDANKAYLWLTQTEAAYYAGARSFFSLFGDETTGISKVESVVSKDENIYNLNGQKVAASQRSPLSSQLKKGLYIVNGKKVIVK